MSLSGPEARAAAIESLRRRSSVEVLIVGGGVNGIGVFRDLALQGVEVVLVERGDFCSGASAASSHMVHGGIRYLENGEFRLVREAVRERNRLLENAPHLVQPLPTTIPIFKRFSGLLNAPLKFLGLLDRPSERGALVIKIGLILYDLFTRAQGSVPSHRLDSHTESLRRYPDLNPAVKYTATYFDAYMPSPERICVELIDDALRASDQVQALNYVSLSGFEGGMVTLRDELTGEELRLRPQLLINAAGPWIDRANLAIGRGTHFIGGTKGSHIVLNHPDLLRAIGGNEFYFENEDGRFVLIFPLHDRVIVGTTDQRIDNPDEARCGEEEVDYFFEMIGRVFPAIEIDRSQIVFRFSGVRPLPASETGFTGQISRDHSLKVSPPSGDIKFPVYSLIGGKWTTFRAFSEQAADTALEYLGRERVLSTEERPIGGGADFPVTEAAQRSQAEALAKGSGLTEERALTLLQRYGQGAAEVADFIRQGEDQPLQDAPEYSQREIRYLARHEMVVHLDDLILRRTLLAMLGKLDGAALDLLAILLAEDLGWPEAQRRAEIERTRRILLDRHGVSLSLAG